VATKIDMALARQRNVGGPEHDTERWSPFASVCFATASSAVLWVLIIQGIVQLL
jgi:hypothetical protein